MPEQYSRKPNITCIMCSKSIYRRPRQIDMADGRVFCSMTCYGISCRKEKSCVICGKMIQAQLNKKTCSRSCANKNRTGIQYHLGSPRDKVKSQRALKTRLFETRGEKCERCQFDLPEILQVHHKNRDRSDNRMENLELICPNCHYREHVTKNSEIN